MTLRYRIEYFGKSARGVCQAPIVSKALEYIRELPEDYAYIIYDLETHTVESYRYTQVIDLTTFQNLIKKIANMTRTN